MMMDDHQWLQQAVKAETRLSTRVLLPAWLLSVVVDIL